MTSRSAIAEHTGGTPMRFRSLLHAVGRLARREPFGFAVIVLFLFCTFFGPYLLSQDPNHVDFSQKFLPLSFAHPFGTDNYGRDIFTRIVYGARLEAGLIAATVACSSTIGLALGILAGYFGKGTDYVLSRLVDALLSFPPLLLAMAIAAIVGLSLKGAIVAIAVIGIPAVARVARGETLRVMSLSYVEAARSIGSGNIRIMLRAVLPNVLPAIIIQASFAAGNAVLFEAGLGFIGLGAQPPTPSWGAMLSEAKTYMYQSPVYLIFISIVVTLVILAFNLTGDALQREPRSRAS